MSDLMSDFEEVNPIRLDPERTFVFGLSTAIAIDNSKLEVKCIPGMITDGQQITNCPYNFITGSLELIRSELHKRIDDIIDELYENTDV